MAPPGARCRARPHDPASACFPETQAPHPRNPPWAAARRMPSPPALAGPPCVRHRAVPVRSQSQITPFCMPCPGMPRSPAAVPNELGGSVRVICGLVGRAAHRVAGRLARDRSGNVAYHAYGFMPLAGTGLASRIARRRVVPAPAHERCSGRRRGPRPGAGSWKQPRPARAPTARRWRRSLRRPCGPDGGSQATGQQRGGRGGPWK